MGRKKPGDIGGGKLTLMVELLLEHCMPETKL